MVPDLIDLARHRGKHFGVLVFDAQAQGFGAVHGVGLFNGCRSKASAIGHRCTSAPEDGCAVRALDPGLNPGASRALGDMRVARPMRSTGSTTDPASARTTARPTKCLWAWRCDENLSDFKLSCGHLPHRHRTTDERRGRNT